MGIVNSRSNRTLHNLVQIIAIPLQCSSCNYVMYGVHERNRDEKGKIRAFLFLLVFTFGYNKNIPGLLMQPMRIRAYVLCKLTMIVRCLI